MNAQTFFPEVMFRHLKSDIAAQKIVGIFDTPYQKSVKTHGNTYKLSITTGRYIVGNHDYFVSLWYDYNYSTRPGGSREQGGGTGAFLCLDSYESFIDSINRLLKKYPDYIPEPYIEQLSLF